MLPTGGLCTTTVHTYSSNADFVDEVRVIPVLTLTAGTTTTSSAACGSSVSTVTYSYDSQHRLTQVTSGTSAITYTAWDSSGRPTAGSFTGTTITNVYNDTLRTSTQSQLSGGVTSVTTTTFDLNGNPQQVVNTVASVLALTTTSTTTATGQVCK
jgi:YD repeat-containing protein